jgi:hypothetical protein
MQAFARGSSDKSPDRHAGATMAKVLWKTREPFPVKAGILEPGMTNMEKREFFQPPDSGPLA